MLHIYYTSFHSLHDIDSILISFTCLVSRVPIFARLAAIANYLSKKPFPNRTQNQTSRTRNHLFHVKREIDWRLKNRYYLNLFFMNLMRQIKTEAVQVPLCRIARSNTPGSWFSPHLFIFFAWVSMFIIQIYTYTLLTASHRGHLRPTMV